MRNLRTSCIFLSRFLVPCFIYADVNYYASINIFREVLVAGYVIKLFHLIEVSTSFEGAFVHFRLLTCTFTSGAIMHDVYSGSVCTTSSILWL